MLVVGDKPQRLSIVGQGNFEHRHPAHGSLGLDVLRLDGSSLLPAVLGSPLVDGIAVGSLISRLPCLDGLAVSFSELAVAPASRFPAFLVGRIFPPSTHRSTLHHVMARQACSRR